MNSRPTWIVMRFPIQTLITRHIDNLTTYLCILFYRLLRYPIRFISWDRCVIHLIFYGCFLIQISISNLIINCFWTKWQFISIGNITDTRLCNSVIGFFCPSTNLIVTPFCYVQKSDMIFSRLSCCSGPSDLKIWISWSIGL